MVKVTSDTVHLESGPMRDSLAQRVASKMHGLPCIETVSHREQDTRGPPPPSPPASDEVDDEQSRLERDRTMSNTTIGPSIRTSTDTKASVPPVASSSKPSVPQSEYLQPPPISSHNLHRPARRNTTGSVAVATTLPSRSARTSLTSQHPHSHSFSSYAYDDNVIQPSDDVEDDIQAHAEKIRRERQEKRAKQAEAEAALTREATRVGLRREATQRKAEEFPLVGNLIGEDHVNYVLMYNMLTGIRIGVGIFLLSSCLSSFFSRCRDVKQRLSVH